MENILRYLVDAVISGATAFFVTKMYIINSSKKIKNKGDKNNNIIGDGNDVN